MLVNQDYSCDRTSMLSVRPGVSLCVLRCPSHCSHLLCLKIYLLPWKASEFLPWITYAIRRRGAVTYQLQLLPYLGLASIHQFSPRGWLYTGKQFIMYRHRSWTNGMTFREVLSSREQRGLIEKVCDRSWVTLALKRIYVQNWQLFVSQFDGTKLSIIVFMEFVGGFYSADPLLIVVIFMHTFQPEYRVATKGLTPEMERFCPV